MIEIPEQEFKAELRDVVRQSMIEEGHKRPKREQVQQVLDGVMVIIHEANAAGDLVDLEDARQLAYSQCGNVADSLVNEWRYSMIS